MPLHVRAGAILPLGPLKEYVEQRVSDPMTVVVYPGADGAFAMYEDDGRSFDYRKGEFTRIGFIWRDAIRQLSLRLEPGSRLLPPEKRPMQIRLAGSKDTRRVVFEGTSVEVTF